jgi:UDP-N-acetylmuramate dehydrogenase
MFLSAKEEGIAMKQVIDHLKEAQVGKVYTDEPLKHHTTWKIGGPADLLVIPDHLESLVTTMQIIHQHRIPWKILGRGSNVLVLDGGIRGAVIKLTEGFEHLRFEGERVIVGAGNSLINLSVQVGKMGLTGMEFAGGIPGTVGGAVYMNAGAHGSDVSKILEEALILWEDGKMERLKNKDLEFSYRTSILQKKRGIVIEATFALKQGNRKEIAAQMASHKERRRQTQPLQEPCAGSVFRNPPGDFAGRLIEACGLKGYQIGHAMVSDRHANFIVNRGNATAKDVLQLIQHIKKEVYDRFQVELEPEVLVMGEEQPEV